MKSNLTLMNINGEMEYVSPRGDAQCITPYRDEDGDPVIGWATIIQRIGEECLSAVMVDPPTHKLVARADVDYDYAVWNHDYYKRKHRGRRSNSHNKQRLRAEKARVLLLPENDDLPF